MTVHSKNGPQVPLEPAGPWRRHPRPTEPFAEVADVRATSRRLYDQVGRFGVDRRRFARFARLVAAQTAASNRPARG